MGEEIREGKVVISTVVDGFANPNEADDYVAEEDFDEFDEEDDDDGKGGSKALTKKLEELKREALTRFDRLRALFEKMHGIYDKDGYGGPRYMEAQVGISEELIVSHHLRRQMMLNIAFGPVDHHRARFAAIPA